MESKTFTRRKFIAGTGAAAISLSIMEPAVIFGSNANSKIKIGMIGCGGRGTWIADLFMQNGNYEIVGAADYFKDKVDAFGEKFQISDKNRFTGLSGYKRLLETAIDAVVIETPPYFHPEQAEVAVESGKHVYLAKPIAVDVPGCQSIEESGKTATQKNLCYLVDFQTRVDQFYLEALKRVHEGALGSFAFGEASYHAGSPWGNQRPYLDSDPANPENQLRAWGMSRALSGDIITEQNIHTLDVMSWIMNEKPVYAAGTGGHKVRTDKGSSWDHYSLVYQYPNNVGITFSSRQFKGHGTTPEGIRNRMFGSEGVLETQYGGNVIIKGDNYYRGGRSPGIFKEGAVTNITSFYENITNGNYENITVEPSVTSNLVTILGRTAALEGRPVYWHQLMKDEERLLPNLKGLID